MLATAIALATPARAFFSTLLILRSKLPIAFALARMPSALARTPSAFVLIARALVAMLAALTFVAPRTSLTSALVAKSSTFASTV